MFSVELRSGAAGVLADEEDLVVAVEEAPSHFRSTTRLTTGPACLALIAFHSKTRNQGWLMLSMRRNMNILICGTAALLLPIPGSVDCACACVVASVREGSKSDQTRRRLPSGEKDSRCIVSCPGGKSEVRGGSWRVKSRVLRCSLSLLSSLDDDDDDGDGDGGR